MKKIISCLLVIMFLLTVSNNGEFINTTISKNSTNYNIANETNSSNTTTNILATNSTNNAIEVTDIYKSDSDKYYFDAVMWAVSKKIATVNNKKVGIGKNATRGYVTDLLYGFYGRKKYNGENIYKDINNNTMYKDAIIWASYNGIVNGYDDNTFKASNNVTRAEFITMLWRMSGCPIIKSKLPFSDIKSSDYYYNAIKWAYNEKIVKGVSTNVFNPNGNIKIEDAITFLYRYNNGIISSFDSVFNNINYGGDQNDVARIVTSAIDGVSLSNIEKQKAIQIINEDSGTHFDPNLVEIFKTVLVPI